MKNCKTWMIATSLGAMLCLSGCGTISFFPYESAAKAADKVLDDIISGNRAPESAQGDSAKMAETKKL